MQHMTSLVDPRLHIIGVSSHIETFSMLSLSFYDTVHVIKENGSFNPFKLLLAAPPKKNNLTTLKGVNISMLSKHTQKQTTWHHKIGHAKNTLHAIEEYGSFQSIQTTSVSTPRKNTLNSGRNFLNAVRASQGRIVWHHKFGHVILSMLSRAQ